MTLSEIAKALQATIDQLDTLDSLVTTCRIAETERARVHLALNNRLQALTNEIVTLSQQ
jgi:hypothetical protein